jgi:hypothetical protein
MKKILITLLFGVIIGCSNADKEAKISEFINVIKENTNVDSLYPEINKPLLIARGSEPGWFAEFYWDYADIALDHGNVKLKTKYDFSKIGDGDFKVDLEELNSKELIHIEILKKSCVEEASGESRERSIRVTYREMVYEGCATMAL